MLYSIIYADPPWQYEKGTVPEKLTIEKHYPTMTLEEIKKFNVPSKKNSVCFLWCTSPKLNEGLEVLKAWNFIYRTCLIWDKKNLGLGHWFRIQHELLLVGKKGSFPTPPMTQRIRSIYSKKRRNHSEKPDYIRRMIELWYPKFNKIELFARHRFEEWDVKGLDAPNESQTRLD